MSLSKKFFLLFSFLLAVLLFQNFSSSVQQQPLVFVLAGQSNMNGQYSPTQPNQAIPSNVVYYNQGIKQSIFASNGKAGPEIGIAQVLSQKFPSNKIVLVKYAHDGTAIRRWVKNAMTNEGLIAADSGDLFPGLVRQVNSVLSQLPPETQVNGFFWMQGESDADEFIRFDAKNELQSQYVRNMKSFLIQIRSEMRLASDFQFIQGRIFPYSLGEQVLRGTADGYLRLTSNFISIRTAQSNLGVKTVSTDSLQRADFWHFSGDSQLAFGRCLASAFFASPLKLGCDKNGRISSASYSLDSYSDRAMDLYAQISSVYKKYQNRSPDFAGGLYWASRVFRGDTTNNELANALASAGTKNYQFSCAESGGIAINGDCHFEYSCLTKDQATSAIGKMKRSYATCQGALAKEHSDCKNGYGASQAFVASCPLLNGAEVLSTDFNNTMSDQKIKYLYANYRKRLPDAGGYNYWKTRSLAELEAALKSVP